jgi:acetyl-CoA carboxylase biotin carboxylase subunit
VGGIKTNLGFFRSILDDPAFRSGDLHTRFIDEFLARRGLARKDGEEVPAEVAILVAAIHTIAQTPGSKGNGSKRNGVNPWRQAGRSELLR